MSGSGHGRRGSGAGPRSGGQRRVLVVDDSRADRDRYRHMLGQHVPDWEILQADTGENGLEVVLGDRPDCVLLDFYLPDMDGIEFIEELVRRTGDSVPIVPVAVLTGRDDRELAQRALRAGAQDYLVKGTLSPLGLVRLVENAMERHAERRERERQRAALEMRAWQLELARGELQQKVGELAAATKAKDQFMAVMSHEMRTPLNAILGYAELLEMGVHGELEGRQLELVERVRTGGRHLLALINDVLDLTRADTQEIELELAPVDLVAVAEEVTRLLEREAATEGLRLRLEVPERPMPEVRGDLLRIRQILTNLVGNAIKFTEDGEVVVRFDRTDGIASVEVRDTGIGIDPDVLPLVFDRFFQADGSYTRRHSGSGLGLSIAQRMAHLMGGDIRVDSVPGEGSSFTLLLPIAEDAGRGEPERVVASVAVADLGALPEEDGRRESGAGTAAEPEAGPGGPGATGGASVGGRTVVVAAFSDDDDALRALGEQLSDGVRLVWTTEEERVRDLAVREGAGLVVLDVSAAQGAGWLAAHSLQDVPELASTALLLLPGIPSPSASDGGEGLDLGWVSLVPKPFTEEQLTDAVSRAAVGHRGRRREGQDDGEGAEVLVIDDDPDSRHVARRFLSDRGLRVQEAEDGESALVAMRFRRPDVVVLDLMMPVLDGFGVLAAMRADARLSDIPVVVLSAKSLSQAERRFLASSAARVLQKGQHRLADVAELVSRAAAGAPGD